MSAPEGVTQVTFGTLDAWTRCTFGACDKHVPLPASRCYLHDGPDGFYMETLTDGTTVYGTGRLSADVDA